jgi:hypothetical protein
MSNARRAEFIALLLCIGVLPAADGVSSLPSQPRISWECPGHDAMQALAAVSQLNGTDQEMCEDDLLAKLGSRLVTFRLVDAAAAGQRQAIAHALDTWWQINPDPRKRERILYCRAQSLPHGVIEPRTHTSTLAKNPGIEPVVTSLMRPWLDMPDAGLAYVAEDGMWLAALNSDGHAHLDAVLSVVERGEPQCPSLIPDADEPDERVTLGKALRADSWTDLALRLSRELKISVSVSPRLAERSARPELTAGALPAIRDQLERAGAVVRSIHGIMCLDTQPIVDRELPAQRRRLALLPIGNLARAGVDAELIVVSIKRRVAPASWELPGWGIHQIAANRALLVAADVPTIAQVLDALDRIDALGIDAAFASPGPESPQP